MPPPEAWLLELASRITTHCSDQGDDDRTGGGGVPMAIEIDAEKVIVSDVSEDPDSGTHEETWYEVRIYPVASEHTVMYCVPVEDFPKLHIMMVNATGFEGTYDGHQVAVNLFCVRPNDAVTTPDAMFWNGRIYAGEPLPAKVRRDPTPRVADDGPPHRMGPDFGDDD